MPPWSYLPFFSPDLYDWHSLPSAKNLPTHNNALYSSYLGIDATFSYSSLILPLTSPTTSLIQLIVVRKAINRHFDLLHGKENGFEWIQTRQVATMLLSRTALAFSRSTLCFLVCGFPNPGFASTQTKLDDICITLPMSLRLDRCSECKSRGRRLQINIYPATKGKSISEVQQTNAEGPFLTGETATKLLHQIWGEIREWAEVVFVVFMGRVGFRHFSLFRPEVGAHVQVLLNPLRCTTLKIYIPSNRGSIPQIITAQHVSQKE